MAVATTVDSIEAKNRLSMIPAVTRIIRLRDIESFQFTSKSVQFEQSYSKTVHRLANIKITESCMGPPRNAALMPKISLKSMYIAVIVFFIPLEDRSGETDVVFSSYLTGCSF